MPAFCPSGPYPAPPCAAPVVAVAFTLHLPPELILYQRFSVSITLSFSDLTALVGIVSAQCPQNSAEMATYAPAGGVLCFTLAARLISRLRSLFCSRQRLFRSVAVSAPWGVTPGVTGGVTLGVTPVLAFNARNLASLSAGRAGAAPASLARYAAAASFAQPNWVLPVSSKSPTHHQGRLSPVAISFQPSRAGGC